MTHYAYEDVDRAERDRDKLALHGRVDATRAKLRQLRAEIRDIAGGLTEREVEVACARTMCDIGEALAGVRDAVRNLAKACAEAEAEIDELERIRSEVRLP